MGFYYPFCRVEEPNDYHDEYDTSLGRCKLTIDVAASGPDYLALQEDNGAGYRFDIENVKNIFVSQSHMRLKWDKTRGRHVCIWKFDFTAETQYDAERLADLLSAKLAKRSTQGITIYTLRGIQNI